MSECCNTDRPSPDSEHTGPGPSDYHSYAGEEFDLMLNDSCVRGQAMPAASMSNMTGGLGPAATVSSPEACNTASTPDVGTTPYPTPDYSYSSPPASQPPAHPGLGDTPLVDQFINMPQLVNTPALTSVSSPMCVVSPGSEAGASSSPRSPRPLGSPPATQRLAHSSSGADRLRYQGSNMPESTLDPKQRQAMIRMLRSCIFRNKNVSLGDGQIKTILKAGACLLMRNAWRMLQPLFEKDNCAVSSLNGLGLPPEWTGIDGAVNYLRVLDADKDKKNALTLGPLAKRTAQILLYLNYERLCKQGTTDIVSRILDAYHDDPNRSKTKEFRRANFSTYHVRRGRWWWRLAASLGHGILLVADNDLMRIMYVY